MEGVRVMDFNWKYIRYVRWNGEIKYSDFEMDVKQFLDDAQYIIVSDFTYPEIIIICRELVNCTICFINELAIDIFIRWCNFELKEEM
jgi:hypothetical protein